MTGHRHQSTEVQLCEVRTVAQPQWQCSGLVTDVMMHLYMRTVHCAQAGSFALRHAAAVSHARDCKGVKSLTWPHPALAKSLETLDSGAGP